ncbi:MAG: ABC transporter permease [Pseudomonadota bacterium]
MTSAGVTHTSDPGYTRLVLSRVLKHRGARFGLIWTGLLVLFSVFAPLFASSHPLLIVNEGGLSSPMLRYLSAVDVILLLLFIFAAVLILIRYAVGRVYWSVVLVTLLISVVQSFYSISPPKLVVYEQYRQDVQLLESQLVLMAPVPFSPKDYLRDAGDTGFLEPLESSISTHWLGTDENGADVLSRMIHASRIALGIGFVATGIAMFVGVIIGGLMGYFSGVVDVIGMRLVEIFEAVPTLFLLLTFVAFFDRNIYLLMVIIGITSWPGYARYVRAEYLRLREQEFVQAAVICDLPLWSILFRHILPNGIAPVLVAASFGVASAILAESTLSFLGLGLVDDPSWGQMLNQAVQSSSFYWWMAFFPGGAIFLTVFSYNLIGDALRDAIDPNSHKMS